MKYTRSLISVLALAVAMACGCEVPPPHPPENISELRWWQDQRGEQFTGRTIALHNIKRVISDELAPDDRVNSLAVVEAMGEVDSASLPALAAVLGDPTASQKVRLAVLAYLIRSGYPDLAGHVVAALPHATDPKLRSAVLSWLEQNPAPGVLAAVVKLWAADKPGQEDETRYRRVVRRLSGKRWDDALLDGLNSSGFYARGSAIEVLSRRLPVIRLEEKIAALNPRTEAVLAMQYFLERFGRLPRMRGELIGMVVAYGSGPMRLDRAATLANEWEELYGYSFNVRDLHLLSRLAGDPLRNKLSRQHLKVELSTAIAARAKVRAVESGRAFTTKTRFRRGRLVDFDYQIESLSLADLWNLALISEMMDRQRFKLAVKIIVERDRADRDTQWAGLISYLHGKGEAKLYLTAEKRGDDGYIPPLRMLTDAYDCLCYFVGHFSRDEINADNVGPTDAELAFVKRQNLYGLVLTSLDGGWVNACYFNPQGVVIDLGGFSVGRPRRLTAPAGESLQSPPARPASR